MTHPTWTMIDPRCTMEHLGFLPYFLDTANPAKARDQFNANYAHGGGWHNIPGFTMRPGDVLHFPGDPPFKPMAETRLRDERIVFYDCALVAVIQPDGSFEVSRMD